MSVLIITWTGENDSVRQVTRHLEDDGLEVLRLDSDLYPEQVQISTAYGRGGCRRVVRTPQVEIDLAHVTAVWYRRFRAGSRLPAALGDTREPSLQETRQTLWGTIATLDCFQLDPLHAVRRADYKELQTRLAIEVGLDVPRTLFTNDPQAVRAFYDELEGRVVTKMQSHFAVYRDGRDQVVFTNRVKPEDLEGLDGLRYCPMIFQEMVPKRLELRAVVVGRQVFTAAVDSQASAVTEVDWRRDGVGLIDRWQPYTLPPDVERALLALTEAFGLHYAAADFMVTPDGRHVFLEINASGEWFWLQESPGLPIARAMADLLREGSRGKPVT